MASFVFVLKLSLINGSVLLLTGYIIKETVAANLHSFPRHPADTFETSQNITARYEAKNRSLIERVFVAATLKLLGWNFCCFALNCNSSFVDLIAFTLNGINIKRRPLCLESIIEELLGTNSSDIGLETREYGHGDPLR
jgi:hypothetical protein